MLGRGKKERRPPFPSSHCSRRARFLSPALPLPFLSLVFTNRSLCGGESPESNLQTGVMAQSPVKIILIYYIHKMSAHTRSSNRCDVSLKIKPVCINGKSHMNQILVPNVRLFKGYLLLLQFSLVKKQRQNNNMYSFF